MVSRDQLRYRLLGYSTECVLAGLENSRVCTQEKDGVRYLH